MKARFFLLMCLLFLYKFSFAQKNFALSFDKTQMSKLIDPPNVSFVVNDSADPVSLYGVKINAHGFSLFNNDCKVKATSNDQSIVTDDNIFITKDSSNIFVKIKSYSIGYVSISINVTEQSVSKSIDINFAISQGGVYENENTRWHVGNSDASAAIALNNDLMIVGDDEMNKLFIHPRNNSGLSVSVFDYNNFLNLSDGEPGNYKEVDVEAAAQSPFTKNRIYWLGSMSNSASYKLKPNRNRLFATDVLQNDSSFQISFKGFYDDLRQQLINVGNKYGYHFSASAASGKNAKQNDGFNAEGMVFAPDSTTLYIGMRAPLVPFDERKNAVIIPIKNFESWFNDGKEKGTPVFDEPIELNLNGNGIRDITRLSNGLYIIIAGSSEDVSTNPGIYKWSGKRSDSAVLISSFDVSTMKAEAVMEVDDKNGKLIPNELQILSDDGEDVYYGDNIPAKNLPENNFKKFHSDILIADHAVLNE